MKRLASVAMIVMGAVALSACVQPGDGRSELEGEVGLANGVEFDVVVRDGLAAVRSLEGDTLVLWAQAPVLDLDIDSRYTGTLHVQVLNCMPGAELVAGDAVIRDQDPIATRCSFTIELAQKQHTLRIAPPDWSEFRSYRFAVLGDIQRALDNVEDVFEGISADANLRFVVCTGDITQDAEHWEFDLYEEKLAHLQIPIFATVGNHDIRKPATRWQERFGRFNVHYSFKGVVFSLVDSGNATLAPKTYELLDDWLDEARDDVHVFATHIPPFDPIGGRSAAFRSRSEAAKLLSRLGDGAVDVAFYGHIHSYYEYENAGIPAYVSGGGGARPELYEGVGRHFLAITVDPIAGILSVDKVPIGEP